MKDILTAEERESVERNRRLADAVGGTSLATIIDRLVALLQSPAPCVWTEDYEGTWETGCGEAFVFNAEGPAENNVKFCCYCGHPIKEKCYIEQIDEEDSDEGPVQRRGGGDPGAGGARSDFHHDVLRAVLAAKGARFEHGENGLT